MEKCNSPISYLIAMNNSAIAESRARDFLRQTRSHLRDFQLRAEIEMTMEALKCNTTRKRLLMRFLDVAVERWRCGTFLCRSLPGLVGVSDRVIKMIDNKLGRSFRHCGLFFTLHKTAKLSRGLARLTHESRISRRFSSFLTKWTTSEVRTETFFK
jgi:hypothetical protein